MKIRLTFLTLMAGLMAFNVNAQDNPPGRGSGRSDAPGGAPGGAGGGGRTRFQPPTAEETKKFDKDGDGKLSREEMRPLMEERQKALEKKYDANNDGKLDEEEKKKMDAENPRPGTGGRGPGGQPPTAEEIKAYDKNADGKLDGEEAVALREARQKARMEKYDTDKDGKLSDEEQKKMIDDLRAARPAGEGGRPGSGRPGRTRPNAGDGEKKADEKIPVPGSAPAPAAETK